MTLPKKPLPSLRFIALKQGKPVFQLIPQTDAKGNVVQDKWALPGGAIESTDALIHRCRKNRWQWNIIGNDGRRRGEPTW